MRRKFIVSSADAFADLFRDGQRMLDARAEGRAPQIVSREPETWAQLLKNGQAFRVPQIVLRKSARVKRGIGKDRAFADLEERRDFFMDQGHEFVRQKSDGLRIGGTADEAGEQSLTLGGATGEERGVPDGAQGAKPLGAGNQEAEPVQ